MIQSQRAQIGENQVTPKGTIGIIFLVMLMDVVGISILYPVAPYLVKRYSDEALMVTMLTVIYAAAQFLAALVLYLRRRGVIQATSPEVGFRDEPQSSRTSG